VRQNLLRALYYVGGRMPLRLHSRTGCSLSGVEAPAICHWGYSTQKRCGALSHSVVVVKVEGTVSMVKVVVTGVPELIRKIFWPLDMLMVCVKDVNVMLSNEYVPLVMLMVCIPLNRFSAMAPEGTRAPARPVAVLAKLSTVCVVLVKVALTFPMVRVEMVAVPRAVEEVCVTVTVSPFFTVPAVAVAGATLTEYLLSLPTEPVTLMGLLSAVKPATVMASEVTVAGLAAVLTAAPVLVAKEN